MLKRYHQSKRKEESSSEEEEEEGLFSLYVVLYSLV